MKRNRFDSVVSRYPRRVFTFASYLLGDPGEAEDITQKVLIKLWRRSGMMSHLGEMDLSQ